ncbi:Importin-9 [Schistosoma japonicum]|nr:Importin-9 [Schistosoma japonicum]
MTKEGVLSYIFHIDQLPSPKYFVSRKGLKSLLLSAAVGGAVISVVYYWLKSKRLKRPTSQSEDVDDVDAATTLSMHTIDYYSQTKLSSNRSAGSVLSRTSNMSDKRLLSSARRSPPLITNDFDDCSCSGLDYKKLGLHALAGVVEHLESLMSKVKILEEKGLSPSSSDSDNLINDLRILLEHAYRLREQYKQQLVIHDSTYRQGSLESLTTQEDTSSFFSASEQIDLTELELLMQFNVRRPLYYNALKLLNEGEVPYRALRTQFVGCELDIEYLGKVHCIRQGFDHIFNCPKPASWVIEVGKLNVCRLLHCLKYPLIDFEENYDRLMEFIISQQNKPNNMMSEELFSKGVKVINFYDVVIDLMLLDAFELLANPPSSVLSVTRHKWLSDNFKRCALDSTVWTILLAKRKLLKYPDGFYAHYYSMVGTVLPALAWGFLGPNENYFRICDRFLFFMDAPTQAIVSAFSIVLGLEAGNRQAAEESLTALEVLEDYAVKVANIFLSEQFCVELRQLSGITLKNYLSVHWSETSCMSFKPPEICDTAKSLIRSGMLQLLTSPHRLIRMTAVHIITLIAQHDWPEMWPDLFNHLITLVRQSSSSNDNNVNKNTVHGVLRVLTEVSSDLSDLDLPIVGPYIMPELLRIYSDKQTYDQSTRRRAIITIDNLLNIAIMCHNEDILNDFVNRYICPSLGEIINDLTNDEDLTVSNLSHKGELIQLLTTLCVENPKFFSYFPGYNISQMINIVLSLVVSCVKQYTEMQITSNSANNNEDEYDSDGEVLDYDTFVYSVLQCLTSLISSKSKRSMIKYLDDLCFQLCQLVQLPEKALITWSNNISEYVVDSGEILGYSVRLVTVDLIKKIASSYHDGPQFINHAINKMLKLSENLNSKGDPCWWKLFEASLYITGNLASNSINIFNFNKSMYQTSNNVSNLSLIEFDVFYEHYLKPSLEQNDFPFLHATALRCMSHLYEANTLNEFQAQCFPSLLSNSMSATQSPILRISAMLSLDALGAYKSQKQLSAENSSSTPINSTSSSTSSVWITTFIVPQLPNLISNLLECLSTFGESVLNIGLCGLYKLLLIDLHQFTHSIITQIIPILVGLFKHCFGVASTLSHYTKIIRVVYKVCSPSKESVEMIENAFMPTLIGCLENHETSDCGSVEATLKVFSVLISPSEFGISSTLIQRVFPAVVHIAITSTDAVVISECCDVIRCYLAAGSAQILEWHDDEGNNGVGYILHITSRLLDPSNPVEWATPAGKLAYAILLHFDAQQLRENTDLLLRGVLARLCTLLGNNHKQPSQLVYSEHHNGLHGARQSLLFVIILLFRIRTKLAIDFLSTIPDLSGKPILQEILSLWCNCQPYYFSRYEIHVSTMALANLILHTINTKDERIMQITLQEEMQTDNSSGSIQTRAKSSQQTKTLIDIPIIVSMYKLLLNELNKKLEEEECDSEDNSCNEFYDEVEDDNSSVGDDAEEVQTEQQEKLCEEDENKVTDQNDQYLISQKKKIGQRRDTNNSFTSNHMQQDDDEDDASMTSNSFVIHIYKNIHILIHFSNVRFSKLVSLIFIAFVVFLDNIISACFN